MQPVSLEDLQDPRLEPYRAVRDRDLVGRQGRFIAEGRVVLEALLAGARFPLESVLVSTHKLPGLRPLLERVPSSVPIYTLPREAMYEVTGFPIHRGLLAVGERTPAPTPDALLAAMPEEATVLVLEGLTNHDNVGACFRNAAALGADAIILDATCCDPLYRKAIRVSAGHALRLPFARGASTGEILSALRDAAFTTVALGLSPRAQALDSRRRPGKRVALLLGTEGRGLSEVAMTESDQHLRIPMTPGVDSLNVATAGAVALFALGRPRDDA